MPVNPSPGPSTPIAHGDIQNRTRQFLIQPIAAYNSTLAAWQHPDTSRGIELPTNNDSVLYAQFFVPADFASGMTITPIVRAVGSGNVYLETRAGYAGDGEAYSLDTDSASGQIAVASGNNFVQQLSLTVVAKEDMVSLAFEREGTNAGDTLGSSIYFAGWLVEYTADM